MFKYGVYYLIILIIISSIPLIIFSPFNDTQNSKAADYVFAAKSYNDIKQINLCSFGKAGKCLKLLPMDKAPGYPFLLSLVFGIFGDSSKVATYFNFVISMLIIILLFVILLRITKNKLLSFLIAFSFSMNRLFLEYATQNESVTLAIFFCAFFVFLMSIQPTQKKSFYLILFFSLCGLSLIREEYFLFTIMYVATYLKRAWELEGINRIMIVVLLIFLTLFCGIDVVAKTGIHTDSEGNIFSFERLYTRTINSPILIYLILIIMLIFSILFKEVCKMGSLSFWILLYFCIYLFVYSSYKVFAIERYITLLLLPLYVLIAIVLNTVMINNSLIINKTWKILVISIFCLILLSGIYWPNGKLKLGEGTMKTFDDMIRDIGDGLVIVENSPMISRILVDTNLTASICMDKREIQEIITQNNITRVHLIYTGSKGHQLCSLWFIDNLTTTEKKKSGRDILYSN